MKKIVILSAKDIFICTKEDDGWIWDLKEAKKH